MPLIRNVFLILAFLVFTAACSKVTPVDGRLLPGTMEAKTTPEPEPDRVARMMAVKVVSIEAGGQPAGVVREWADISDYPASDALTAACNASQTCTTTVGCPECGARAALCGAQRLLAASKDEAGGVILVPAEDLNKPANERRQFRLLPQDTAAKVTLSAEAVDAFFNVFSYAAALRGGGGCSTTVGQPAAAGLANTLVDAFYGLQDAQDVLTRSVMAVSDAERSSSPSRTVSGARSVAGKGVSRAALSHYLIGGEYGLKGSAENNFCDVGPLAGPAQAALSVFREAGVAPADVLGTLDTSLLLNGNASQVPNGSVRERLAKFWGTGLTQNVQDYFRLTQTDFEQARAYLAQELKAFSRSSSFQLPALVVNGQTVTYRRYASTANAPPDRDAAYFAALASSDCGDQYCACSPSRLGCPKTKIGGNDVGASLHDDIKPLGGIAQEYRWRLATSSALPFAPGGVAKNRSSVSLKLDSIFSIVDVILKDATLSNIDAYKNGVFGTLQNIATHAPRERPFRLTHCTGGGQNEEFKLNGVSSTANALLISGEENLDALLSRTTEGAPNSVIPVPVVGSFNTLATADVGFDVASSLTLTTLPTSPEHWYVVKPQGSSAAVPGNYEALVGFVPYEHVVSVQPGQPTPVIRMCRDIPVVPTLYRAVKRALAPHREQCETSVTSCAGVDFDKRIPLEDELSTDSDDLESSWQRYLALAEQAASESDLLGQDYVRAAVEVEQNAASVEERERGQLENAAAKLGELQAVCGTAVDPASLLAAVSSLVKQLKPYAPPLSIGNFATSIFDFGACTPGADDGNPLTKCSAGRNVPDLAAIINSDPKLSELKRCLKSMDTYGRVHLGTKTVCIWPGVDGNLCSGAPMGQLCPEIADDNDACPVGATRVDQGLGYFDTEATMPDVPGLTMCGTIRALRSMPGTPLATGAFRNLVGKNMFNPTYLERPTFEARYLTHGAILLKNSVRWSTGSPTEGAQTSSWPCSASAKALNCGPSSDGTFTIDGLFCQARDCTVESERSSIIDRMIKAVAAAQLMRTVNGMQAPRMLLPGYIDAVPGSSQDGQAAFLILGDGQTVDVRDNGSAVAPVRENSIYAEKVDPDPKCSQNQTCKQPNHVHGRAYRANLVADSFARRAWVTPSGIVKDIAPPGKAFAIVDGVVGRDNDFHEAIVSINPLETFLGGMSDSPGADGYLKEVLLGIRNRNSTGAPADHNPNLPTLADLGIDFETLAPTFNFEPEALLDGAELICELDTPDNSFSGASCGTAPPAVTGVDDLPNVSRYLDCLGRTIQRRGALTVFDRFPPEARDALRENSPTGTHSAAITGTLGDQYSALRGALIEVAATGPGVGRELSGLARDMEDLRTLMAMQENYREIADVQFWSTAAQQVANCADGATNLAANFSSFGAHLAINCANAIAQIGFSGELTRLSKANAGLEDKLSKNDFNTKFSNRIAALEDLSRRLSQAVEVVDGTLIEIENSRQGAQRVLNEVLWLLSNESKAQARVNQALANVKETARERYLKAFDNAKLLAFLAKRAIEQRLGVKLAEMTEKLPLVDAPASWEGTVCARTGLDFDVVLGNVPTDTQGEVSPVNYSEGFIGDYAKNLRNTIESYRLQFNFHEGRDSTVVSLRDDVQNVRAMCQTESHNLLHHSARLESIDETRNVSGSWFLSGCRTKVEEGKTVNVPDCLRVLMTDQRPFTRASLETRSVPGYKLRFGDGNGCMNTTTCGWVAGAGLAQTVELPPGLYRFSWYTPDAATGQGALAGFARTASGTNLKPPATDMAKRGTVAGDANRWNRPYFLFELSSATTVQVGFKADNDQPQELLVAAPMLEAVEATGAGVANTPKGFVATTESRMVDLPICEDTHGEVFRSTRWHRACVKLCADGFGSECAGRDGETHCYWETPFNITQRGIESGDAFVQAGFARGNFNYRLESVALNFVGTGLRDCSAGPLATSCNGAGYVSYSLVHNGPYFVRNHFGQDFEAKLFPARIEHARGLGIERYLTNPVGSADRELISDYLRQEFRGRPLDGNFILRVWEEPGFNFQAVEDVQVLLNYRYWTRFQ
jgi:hypothetical protein